MVLFVVSAVTLVSDAFWSFRPLRLFRMRFGRFGGFVLLFWDLVHPNMVFVFLTVLHVEIVLKTKTTGSGNESCV